MRIICIKTKSSSIYTIKFKRSQEQKKKKLRLWTQSVKNDKGLQLKMTWKFYWWHVKFFEEDWGLYTCIKECVCRN